MSETIVTGKKYRILTDVAQKVWQRVSFWTKSTDVEFNDAKTAETKVGAIDGITDSLSSNSSRIAASAKAVNQLNGDLTSVKNNFVDASDMTLNDLYYYKDSYNKPYVFGINWESNLAPDKNFTVGIGILGYLFAASLSGKQYICTEPNNGWQLIIDPSAITADIANLKTSFQDGCNSIVEGLTGLGFAPSSNSPGDIRVAIQRVFDERYNEGYSAGLKVGQSATKSVSVRTFISSHAYTCYAITYINDQEVCRVDSTNPSDDSTITKSNTTQVTI